MSNDYLLMTPTPVTLADALQTLSDMEGTTLRPDHTNTCAVLVRDADQKPLLWLSSSVLISDWHEVLRLLPATHQPPSRHLIYWTEIRSPSTEPYLVERVAAQLAIDLKGWSTPMAGNEE